MIQYDPHHWRSHLLDIRGSMIREVFPRVTSIVLWSAIVVAWHEASRFHIDAIPPLDSQFASVSPSLLDRMGVALAIPLHGHTLIGVALGLLLVFRTNSSYDRFWEGRKLWGGIVNDCRNLARQALSLLKDNPALLDRLLRWTIAFPWSVRNRLQGRHDFRAATVGLPSDEVLRTEQAQHVPLAVARRMTEQVDAARRQGLITDVQQSLLDGGIARLIDAVGACERIHNTPLPYAYMVHLRRALILYLATLPMALVRDFGWATLPAMLLIAYVMLGVEEIGVEIEDPFGDDENDLPLQSICETIENNLSGLAT